MTLIFNNVFPPQVNVRFLLCKLLILILQLSVASDYFLVKFTIKCFAVICSDDLVSNSHINDMTKVFGHKCVSNNPWLSEAQIGVHQGVYLFLGFFGENL